MSELGLLDLITAFRSLPRRAWGEPLDFAPVGHRQELESGPRIATCVRGDSPERDSALNDTGADHVFQRDVD